MDIRHIAGLAALHLDDDETEIYRRDMEAIMAMIDQLPEVSGDMLPDPSDAMLLREDLVADCPCTREALLQNAPQTRDGCVVVPKTVD